MRIVGAAVLVGLACAVLPGSAFAERRVALVVGNAAYSHAPMLRNPTQDAAKVSQVLRDLDFDVTTVTDADKIGMEQAIRRFTSTLDGADVALFYYSGHAVQVGERNYLIPVSAAVTGPRTLNLDAFALQDISSAMRQAGAKIQMLVLDACRDNPFGDALGTSLGLSATRGLAPIDPLTGSLVVFSTSPGQVALDGTGTLSPFTAAFTRYAMVPKLEVRQAVTRIRSEVAEATDNKQIPWDDSSLVSDFYLMPPKPPPVFPRVAQVTLEGAQDAQSLKLTPPIQPEGGALAISIAHPPAAGRLMLASRSITSSDTLTPADFARLSYEPSGNTTVDSFTFKVEDAWGNGDLGMVAINRSLSGPAPASAAPSATPLPDVKAEAVSLLGLGPNLLIRNAGELDKAGLDARLELTSNVPSGQIVIGDRVIEQGRSIEAADLKHLAFIPQPGSEGTRLEATFTTAQPPARSVHLQIDVKMTDCDRLAGDRIDAQGVGEGVLTGQIDTKAALPACETAVKARPNSARFLYELGRVYAALGRNDEALSSFRKASDLGHVRALWALGNHDEVAQPADFVRGKATLERASALGDVYATHALGTIYYEGRGVPKDLDKARGFFETAARVGHTFAMNALGGMYRRGEGVPVDFAMARRYWQESAARGDLYGINNMGFAYLDGIGIEKDPAKALENFKRASELGHPEAPNNVGRMYVLGLGVPVDFAEARKWDAIGADRGDAWAAFNLGELHRLGSGGPVDLDQAGAFYARAAGSLNDLEAAELGRKQLALLDRPSKIGALRHLLADLDPSAKPSSDALVMTAAQTAVSRKGIKPTDKSIDALTIAAAKAVLSDRVGRLDLF